MGIPWLYMSPIMVTSRYSTAATRTMADKNLYSPLPPLRKKIPLPPSPHPRCPCMQQ